MEDVSVRNAATDVLEVMHEKTHLHGIDSNVYRLLVKMFEWNATKDVLNKCMQRSDC
jgi:hypothetical protein